MFRIAAVDLELDSALGQLSRRLSLDRFMFLRCLFALSLLFAPGIPARAGAPVLGADMKALNKADRDFLYPDKKIPALEKPYAKIKAKVAAIGSKRLDESDARDFFEASYRMVFYTNEMRHVREMRAALDELQSRHLDIDRDRKKMLGSYVSARMFDDAKAYAALPMNWALPKPPALQDMSGGVKVPTLLRVDSDGILATRHAHSITHGTEVIVVSSPGCHFSREAADAIARDPEMAAMMKRTSTWIVPQEVVENFAGIAEWNLKYPNSFMEAVYVQTEWPFVASWQTPVFYFMKEGEVVTSVTGWPGDHPLAELRAAFARIENLSSSEPRR